MTAPLCYAAQANGWPSGGDSLALAICAALGYTVERWLVRPALSAAVRHASRHLGLSLYCANGRGGVRVG